MQYLATLAMLGMSVHFGNEAAAAVGAAGTVGEGRVWPPGGRADGPAPWIHSSYSVPVYVQLFWVAAATCRAWRSLSF